MLLIAPPADVSPAPAVDPAWVILEEVMALQIPNGAFPDTPLGGVANADSNMLYLLTGIAEQAKLRQDPRLWAAVERGLAWLGDRLWEEGDPLPDVFPDALPMTGKGRCLGDPPVAGIGATAARFVALVGALPQPHPTLKAVAKRAWKGLQRFNLDEGGFIWNAWIFGRGRWVRSSIRYAADQADFLAGMEGARKLGFEIPWRDPLGGFPLGTLAMNDVGQAEPLPENAQQGAWAVLAFDGPDLWRTEALSRLKALDQGDAYLISLAARAAWGDGEALERMLRHLRQNRLPLDQDRPGSPAYTSVAGFVLRALAKVGPGVR